MKLVQSDPQLNYPTHNPRARLNPINCQAWPDPDRSDYSVVDRPKPARKLHLAKRFHRRNTSLARFGEFARLINCLGLVPKEVRSVQVKITILLKPFF